MALLYYLISSLPTLSASAKAPVSYGEFLSMCRGAASESQVKKLEELSRTFDSKSTEGSSSGVYGLWLSYYCSLQRELANQRLAKMGKPARFASCADSDTRTLVEQAMNAGNPLEAEQILIEGQFRFIDSLASQHFFDEHVLMSYALKLKLLERKNVFTQEKGKKEFSRLFDSIQQQINGI